MHYSDKNESKIDDKNNIWGQKGYKQEIKTGTIFYGT